MADSAGDGVASKAQTCLAYRIEGKNLLGKMGNASGKPIASIAVVRAVT
jgi:hypothetical protein